MAVWKRIGLDDNVPVTETVVITDPTHHRVKYYLKDYTNDMSRRPQFRHINRTNDNSVPDLLIAIPYETWFGADKSVDDIVGSSKYCEYTIYYIHRVTGKVYVARGLAQTVPHDDELSRKLMTMHKYITSRKSKAIALCIPTEQWTWSTEKYSPTMVNPELLKNEEPTVETTKTVETHSSGIVDLLKKWFKKE